MLPIPMLPTESSAFRFRRSKNRWRPSWIERKKKLILIYNSFRCFLPSFKLSGLLVQEKKVKIYFQDGGHLGSWIGTILAFFYLQVTLMFSTKFLVNWPLGSGEEAKNRFFKIATTAAILDFRTE